MAASTFYYLPQRKTTTLATVGGIDASQTDSIKLTSVANIETSKPGIIAIDWSNPIDETKIEYITYTSIDGNNELVGATRGAEDSTGRVHSNGVTIAFVVSKSHVTEVAKALDGTNTGVTLNTPVLNTGVSGTAIVDEDNMASDSATKIPTQQSVKAYADLHGMSITRQAVMNGNFDVWQRGTSFTNPASGTYMPDRWRNFISPDGGTPPSNIVISRQQQTSGDLFGSFNFLRIAPDGAGSGYGASAVYEILQRIEYGTRFLCGDGKKVTLSFWAKSSIANKKIGVKFVQTYGDGGTPSSSETIAGEAFTLTSSWQKFTHTFTTNTLAGKTFGSNLNDWCQIAFGLMWGTSTDANYGADGAEAWASGTIDIAQVQLCAGDVALPFQPKSFEEELKACQRYYQKSFLYATAPAQNAGRNGTVGFTQIVGASTVQICATVRLAPSMRVAPTTLTLYNPQAANAQIRNVTGGNDFSLSAADQASDSQFRIYGTTPGGSALGGVCEVHWTADAEL